MAKVSELLFKINADTAAMRREFAATKSSVDKMQSNFKMLGTAIAAAFSVRAIKSFAQNAMAAYDKQSKAEAALLTALDGRRDIQQRLIKQAEDLQSKTLFGDEVTIQAQALAASMGLTSDQITKLIPAAQDLSTVTGMSLDTAVKNLARTYGGLAGELGEAIPRLRELTKEEMAAGKAIDLVNELMGGQAEVAASVGTGPLTQLKNAFADLTEVFGKAIVKGAVFHTVMTGLKEATEDYSNLLNNDLLTGGQKFLLILAKINPALAENLQIWFEARNAVKLSEAGFDIEDLEKSGQNFVDLLKGTADETQKILDGLENKFSDASDSVVSPINRMSMAMLSPKGAAFGVGRASWMDSDMGDYNPYTNQIEGAKEYTAAFADMSATFKRTEENAKNLRAELTQITLDLKGAIIDIADAFGQLVGEAILGNEGALENFGKNILEAMASFITQFGEMLVAYGTAELVFESSPEPTTKIIAGAALIALGGALRAMASQKDKLNGAYSGAGVAGSGYQRPNYEYETAKIQVEVVGQISNKDIYLSTKRGETIYTRTS